MFVHIFFQISVPRTHMFNGFYFCSTIGCDDINRFNLAQKMFFYCAFRCSLILTSVIYNDSSKFSILGVTRITCSKDITYYCHYFRYVSSFPHIFSGFLMCPQYFFNSMFIYSIATTKVPNLFSTYTFRSFTF